MSLVFSFLSPTRDQSCEVGAVMKKPFESRGKLGHRGEYLLVENLHGKQGNESDHRAYFHLQALIVAGMKNVVKEFIFFIPKTDALVSDVGHCTGDVEEVFKKFCGETLIRRILFGQLERHPKHVERKHRHPACSVRLFDVSASWKLIAPVEHADVVHTKEASLEDVVTVVVFLVDPPGKIQQQLMKYFFQEFPVALAAL